MAELFDKPGEETMKDVLIQSHEALTYALETIQSEYCSHPFKQETPETLERLATMFDISPESKERFLEKMKSRPTSCDYCEPVIKALNVLGRVIDKT